MKKIIFTGGGTAGHIMPNIALISELKDYEIFYLGSNGMEKELISKLKNIKFIEIPTVKFKRSLSLSNLAIPIKLIKAIKQTKKVIKDISPSLIFSKGGYVAIPVCLAGHSLKIPIITHESDLSIGLANKIIAPKSKYLCCSFSSTAEKYKKNAIFTGSPIRNKIIKGNKDTILKRHNIHTNKPIILVMGGSLGAQTINKLIWNNIDTLTQKLTIIHIVGKNNKNNQITNKNYIQLEFVDDIENYFAASDIVISRAGSNTIFELLSIYKPMILIPLPKTSHSRGDQVDNANYFLENKLAQCIYQENLNIELLLKTIQHTLKNKNLIKQNMKNFNNTNGNEKIINLIKKTIK